MSGGGVNVTAGGGGDGADGDELDTKQLYFIAYGIVPPIIIVFGVAGNLLTLIVLSRRHFKAVSYTYIRWLACSDLLAMLIWLPIIVKDGWKVPLTTVHAARYYADWHLLLHNTFLASSAFLVVALSVERYVSVCHPGRAQHLITPFRAKAVVVTIYLVAALIHIPYVFEEEWLRLNVTNSSSSSSSASDETYIVDRNRDVYDSPKWRAVFEAYSWILATVTKFIPIILVCCLNTWTVTAFYRVVEKRQQMAAGSAKKLREQQRIMIMLICVVVIFVSCLLPMPFLYIFFNADNLRYYGFHVFRVCANLLETGNSALNFYVYCVASQDFRHHLRLTLSAACCCCCCCCPVEVKAAAGNGELQDGTTTAGPAMPLKNQLRERLAAETDAHHHQQQHQQQQPLLNNERRGLQRPEEG